VTVVDGLLGIAVVLLAVLVIGLLRSHAEVLRRLHELGAGLYDDELPSAETASGTTAAGVTSPVALSPRPDIRTQPGVAGPRPDEVPGAHDLAGVTPAGDAVAVAVAGAEHTTLLAFLSSGCATCADFWRAFADGAADHLPGRDTRLVIVTKSPEHESVSEVRAVAPPAVTTVMTTAAFDAYGVPVNPYFILVDGPSGRVVGEGAAATWAQVANLLSQAAADHGVALDLTAEDAAPGAGGRPAREVAGLDSRQRDALAEAELLAAGIGPGHPSLYADPLRAPDAGRPPVDEDD
jgi:hypothetical protein